MFDESEPHRAFVQHQIQNHGDASRGWRQNVFDAMRDMGSSTFRRVALTEGYCDIQR